MIVVVMPTFKSKDQVLEVLRNIGPEVDRIIVVDDACPMHTGSHVEQHSDDERVTVLYHEENQGVGGACITGFKHAIEIGATIVVKLDSDGQMDPGLIRLFIAPIEAGNADYTKGNRFYQLDYLRSMSTVRIIGNAGMSFFNKLASGYWDIMDPTNGYVAVHAKVLQQLPLDKISKRFFFESDMLFRLSIERAKIQDIPTRAIYGEESSNLNVVHSLLVFPASFAKRFVKRIFYNYFLRDFSIASVNLLFGSVISLIAVGHGTRVYLGNMAKGIETPTGTIMIIMMAVLIGFQLLLSFINYDTTHTPRTAIHTLL